MDRIRNCVENVLNFFIILLNDWKNVLMGIINQLVLTAPRIATNSRTEKKLEK